MNAEQVASAVAEIERLIRSNIHSDATPKRNQDATTGLQRSLHLLWMCEQIPLFLAEGRTEKAMRWLGFLQGALWMDGIATIETLKRQNAPADAVFDKDRA